MGQISVNNSKSPVSSVHFSLAQIAMLAGATLVRGSPQQRVRSVCTDSRELADCPAPLFIALRGDTHDGHAFVEGVLSQGAVALVDARWFSTHEACAQSGSLLVVDDTLVALGKIAKGHLAAWRKKTKRCVVALTGTAGKTTTKELIAALLASALGAEKVHATRYNFNNRIGVPLTLLSLSDCHHVAVIELGTSVPGEITALAEMVTPDVAMLLNIGTAHAEGLASDRNMLPQQSIALEKSELFRFCRKVAIAYADDPWALASLEYTSETVVRKLFASIQSDGMDCPADVCCKLEPWANNLQRLAYVNKPDATLCLSIALVGEHIAQNLSAAVLACDEALKLLGESTLRNEAMAADAIRTRLGALYGRLSIRQSESGIVVLDDSYNASPESYAVALSAAQELALALKKNLVVFAGEMRELGHHCEAIHQDIRDVIWAAKPRVLVTLGGNADLFAVPTSGVPANTIVHQMASADEALRLVSTLFIDDLVLVKGARRVRSERIVDAILAHGTHFRQ